MIDDTIKHELPSLNYTRMTFLLMRSNLQDRWQRVKINATYSFWTQLLQEVQQGSVFGPTLFNIFIDDIFFPLKGIDMCNFVDRITPYACDSNSKLLLETLEHNSELAVAWFEINYVKPNTDKYHLLVSGNKNRQMLAILDRDIVWESNDIKLLGITLNNKLKFDKQVSNICTKANRKLSTLTRVAKFLTFKKRLILFKAFTSQNLNIVHSYRYFMEGKLMIR